MEVVEVFNSEQLDDAYQVRRVVFVDEQQVPEELEIDEYERSAIHYVVYDGATPVGAGRLRNVNKQGKIERICVLKDYRGQKIGVQIMNTIETSAAGQGLQSLVLNAQTRATNFYKALGYQVTSGEFMDAGIPHVQMQKKL